MKWALAKVPRPLLIRLSYLVQWVAPVIFKGNKFVDPIDGRGYSRFFPYGYGNNQRENALCPGTKQNNPWNKNNRQAGGLWVK